MRNNCEMFELFGTHLLWLHKIANIHNVGLQQLVYCLIGIIADERMYHSSINCGKCMRYKTKSAHLQINLTM